MKIAVTDACIFIDLLNLSLVEAFFQLPLEVHTSTEVMDELFEEQQATLRKHADDQTFTIHLPGPNDYEAIAQANYPSSLSMPDKLVLHQAIQLDATILSSDKVLRNTAKRLAIEYHGILWILDQLIDHQQLSAREAARKLQLLAETNAMFRHSSKLMAEMDKRRKRWKAAD